MASQTLWSGYWPDAHGATGETALLMDAAGEKVAFVVRVGRSGNIHKVHFRTGTVTTGETVLVSLQNLDASGDPDGTADQSGTVVIANGDDGVWKEVTLGTDRTVTAGDAVAVVIEWNASAGNLEIVCADTITFGNVYPDHFTAAWAKQQRSPIVVLEFDDTTICPLAGVFPAASTAVDYANNSTPDEIALILNYPFPVKCSGGHFYGRLTGDCDLVLYDSDGSTVLGSCSLDKDANAVGASDAFFAGSWAAASLAANTTYRLALKPTTTTAVRLRYGVTGTAAHLDTMQGGDGFHWSQQTDAGGWSQTTTQRPYIGAVIEAADDGTGGGGGGGQRVIGG